MENVIKDDVEKPEAPPDDHKISEGEKENEKAVNLDKKADETVGIKDKKQKDVKKGEDLMYIEVTAVEGAKLLYHVILYNICSGEILW